MSRNKEMTIIITVVALVLIVAAWVVWWHIFFGVANRPLPSATVTVVPSSTPSATVASTTTATAAPISSAIATSASVIAAAPLVAGENPPLAEEPLGVNGATFNVEIASTALEQTRGLSFRPSLGPQSGMLFIFGAGSVQSFWMKDMNFPLDIIWISGNTVAGFAQDVPAPASGTALWNLPVYTSPANVDKVLEVNAGTVAKYNIKAGDTVSIGATE